MKEYTKNANFSTRAKDFSRRAHLQPQPLRTQEWEDLPTVAALAVLKRHAEVWAKATKESTHARLERRAA
jgi:hypothetical protein